MSLFSVNTNLGAMAALKSLSQTASAMSQTQQSISTGKKVGMASDNPAVYAISQAMNNTISGLAAVQDGLSFGAQVVTTASTAAAQVSSTLASLQNTLTNGQSTGISASQINQSISAALQQIDTFANSATMNGVNLLSGATGNGVTNTQLQVLTSASGDSFTVGGTGAEALNATSAGLGLNGLSVTSNDVTIALGTDSSSTTTNGMTLVANGNGTTGAAAVGLMASTGNATVNTNIQMQTANYGATDGSQTAQNPGSQTVVMLSDGSTGAKDDIMNELNYLVDQATKAGTAVTGIADNSGATGTAMALVTQNSGAGGVTQGTNFTFDNNGNISLTAGQKGGSITDLGNGSTQYSFIVASDANGNPTQTINVIAANISSLANSATAWGGTAPTDAPGATNAGVVTTGAGATTVTTADALAVQLDGANALASVNGAVNGSNSAANMAVRQQALGTMVSAMNAAGFNASIDTNNNLTIAGNNVNTSGSSKPYSIDSKTTVSNLALASGSGVQLTTAAGAAGGTALGANKLYGVQQADARAAIANVTAAVTKLGTISSSLGTASDEITGMQSYTSSLSNALTAGVGALTDADMASESAKLTSLQTKQQLGIQALSIANQQPQALLKLFGG